MKVKCIDIKNSLGTLTLGKIYNVNEETEESYYIVNNNGDIRKYNKNRFIKVPEVNEVYKKHNNKMVKCIDNKNLKGFLTIDKIYNVLKEDEISYLILDDDNEMIHYGKKRFALPNENNIIVLANEIAELVEKKDKDYNSAFSKTLKEYGNVAYFLRLDDKLNRLKNLMLNNNNAEVNESIEDTLKDIIGYTLLMLKEIKS